MKLSSFRRCMGTQLQILEIRRKDDLSGLKQMVTQYPRKVYGTGVFTTLRIPGTNVGAVLWFIGIDVGGTYWNLC